MTHHTHLIADAIQPVGKLEVKSPFDQQTFATVDTVGFDGVDRALEIARNLYLNREAWLPADERRTILERTADLIQAGAEELALEAAREGGKPLQDSRVELARAVDGVRNCAELLRSEGGSEIPMGATAASRGHLAFTSHEPIGVVAALSAFNHPFNLIVHQVGPAVAAGCPVVVKPASDTPLSCLRFVRLLHEAGLPSVWAQALITDGNDTAGRLASDPRVAFLSFIGSGRVGWHLRSTLAPGTRCALEHGGAAPVIVDRGVNLARVVAPLAKGGFYHAGQVCVSVQRVFAHREIAESLAQGIAEAGQAMRVGDATSADTEIGPLIRPRETDRVHEWVQEAVVGGGRLLCGGEPVSATCYPATVLYDPPDSAQVSRNEVFGPVICVYPFDDLDDAIRRANALPFAFQASVFTRDLDLALDAGRRLDASAVMINDHTAFRVDWMPFAGLRESGLGVGGIPHTFRDMQVEKMLVFKSPALQ